MPAIADGLRRNMRNASTVGCSTFATGLVVLAIFAVGSSALGTLMSS